MIIDPGHAVMGANQDACEEAPEAVEVWQRLGQAKICVKIKGEEEMLSLEEECRAAGMVTHVVCDAGHTQIAAGSMTVLAIGPAPVDVIEPLTAHLKLL